MDNPWYNEVSAQSATPAWVMEQRTREQNQRSADLQRQMMVQDARASGVPIVNGEPQWQTFTSPAQQRQQYQHQGVNPTSIMLFSLIGWLIGTLIDRVRRVRYEQKYAEWEREHGAEYRAWLATQQNGDQGDVN